MRRSLRLRDIPPPYQDGLSLQGHSSFPYTEEGRRQDQERSKGRDDARKVRARRRLNRGNRPLGRGRGHAGFNPFPAGRSEGPDNGPPAAEVLPLRHGKSCPSSDNWGTTHMGWLQGVSMEQPVLQIVLEDYVATVIACTDRVKELEAAIERMLPGWRLVPYARSLQAMRGIAAVTAATIAAETGDIRRFASPEPYMAFIGIIPSEH